jgi:hypothetical protein
MGSRAGGRPAFPAATSRPLAVGLRLPSGRPARPCARAPPVGPRTLAISPKQGPPQVCHGQPTREALSHPGHKRREAMLEHRLSSLPDS